MKIALLALIATVQSAKLTHKSAHKLAHKVKAKGDCPLECGEGETCAGITHIGADDTTAYQEDACIASDMCGVFTEPNEAGDSFNHICY